VVDYGGKSNEKPEEEEEEDLRRIGSILYASSLYW